MRFKLIFTRLFGWTLEEIEEMGVEELVAILEELKEMEEAAEDPWLARQRSQYARLQRRLKDG